jgi:uncharacterized protein YfiM (DUF2279 family)
MLSTFARHFRTASLFLLALITASFCMAVAFGPDHSKAEPLQMDKVAHASVSLALGSSARLITPDPWKAWALAMAPGLAKEIYDARPGGTGFSVPDLIADAIGAAVGVKVAGLAISRNRVTYRRTF